jgi:hypothetical protein
MTLSDPSEDPKMAAIIRADAVDFEFDEGAGGVRLARESAVKMAGKVRHRPGGAEAQPRELLRYGAVAEVPEQAVRAALSQVGGTVICVGRGKELYKDPGETLEADVTLAPVDAVRDALNGAGSAMQYDRIVINFAGGDDLQVLEVLAAVQEMVLDLDIATKAKISFNSVSHKTFPVGTAAVTVVGLPERLAGNEQEVRQDAVQKTVAGGEVYFRDGKYWTVLEQDINSAGA